jgi:deoxyribonuclease V
MRLVNEVQRPESVIAAELLQSQLASALNLSSSLRAPARLIAATDVAYALDDSMAYAAVVVVDAERGFAVVDQQTWVGPPPYPYEPGLFAFREAACLLPAMLALTTTPDVLFVDGQGIAHPRRFGIACQLGWMFDIPTLGCAKTRLHGEPQGDLGAARGSAAPLLDGADIIGCQLRTQDGVKPLFVSPGQHMDLADATALVLSACTTYRIPEPLRAAHHLSITVRAQSQREDQASVASDTGDPSRRLT